MKQGKRKNKTKQNKTPHTLFPLPESVFFLKEISKRAEIPLKKILKCEMLFRFWSLGKFNVIHFVTDRKLLAPSNPPPEIHPPCFIVSLLYKVPPQCNELFIICHHFASFKKITFCSALLSTSLHSPRKCF